MYKLNSGLTWEIFQTWPKKRRDQYLGEHPYSKFKDANLKPNTTDSYKKRTYRTIPTNEHHSYRGDKAEHHFTDNTGASHVINNPKELVKDLEQNEHDARQVHNELVQHVQNKGTVSKALLDRYNHHIDKGNALRHIAHRKNFIRDYGHITYQHDGNNIDTSKHPKPKTTRLARPKDYYEYVPEHMLPTQPHADIKGAETKINNGIHTTTLKSYDGGDRSKPSIIEMHVGKGKGQKYFAVLRKRGPGGTQYQSHERVPTFKSRLQATKALKSLLGRHLNDGTIEPEHRESISTYYHSL